MRRIALVAAAIAITGLGAVSTTGSALAAPATPAAPSCSVKTADSAGCEGTKIEHAQTESKTGAMAPKIGSETPKATTPKSSADLTR